MFNINKHLIFLLRSFALISVFALGLLSILATGGGSSSEDPASFADAGPDQSVKPGLSVWLDGSGSDTPLGASPVGEVSSYLWTVLSSPPVPEGFPSYELSNATTINPKFRTLVEGEHILQLKVDFRSLSATDSVSLFVSSFPPPNTRNGSDQFVKHGTLVTLDASSSHSQREDQVENVHNSNRLPFTYDWNMSEQPIGASSSLSATNVVKPSFIAEYDSNDHSSSKPHYSLYETRLDVVDNDGSVSSPMHVKTYVFPPEGYVFPMPVAGPGQRVVSGSTVELDGSASFDVDDRPLSYKWQFYARPSGSNATLTDAETATPFFVADQDGMYVVHLQVDNGELTSMQGEIDVDYAGSDRVVIIASSDGSAPVPDAGLDRIYPFIGPTAMPLSGSGSYSPSGDAIISYQWYLINAPVGSNASIDTPDDTEHDSASLLADMAGSYVIGLSLDHKTVDFNNDHVVITLTENSPPTASAGIDQTVSVGDTVILNSSSSNDPDGNLLGYSWSLASAPGSWGWQSNETWIDWPSLSDGMAAAPTFIPGLNGEYRLRLTVNDGEISSVADEVLITTSGGAANSAPIADAGADQSVTVGDTVLLDGGGSTDPDSDALTYTWSIRSQPLGSSAAIDDPSSETPDFVVDSVGRYEVQLIVYDGLVNSNPDTMIVTVTTNTAPIADAGADQSVSVGDTVFLDGGGSSDPDNDPLTYSWTIEISPSGSSAAIGDPSSDTPSFVTDVEGSYDVQLIVNDGLLNSNPDTMTVTAATAGACANPLALMTSLPFAPIVEMAMNIQIDAEGADTLSAITAFATVDEDVYTASIPDGSNLDQAEFIVYGSNWQEISRTHANPISDSASPSFVVRNIADNMYYKLDVDFTGTNNLNVQIDALIGCRCGNDAADCP